jgi:eukaryotic translation initiation factor 2C
VQHPRTEIIDGLKEMVINAINSFGQKNNIGPERIIFFRDGVSEGEFDQVAAKEIAAIKC